MLIFRMLFGRSLHAPSWRVHNGLKGNVDRREMAAGDGFLIAFLLTSRVAPSLTDLLRTASLTRNW